MDRNYLPFRHYMNGRKLALRLGLYALEKARSRAETACMNKI